ncbi:hypothetical protein GXN76_11420 [Kroppenstedtia pulmonis]|uniref:Uncharacterized protein n=1 Tax=Kroppenstedtia pulmonis TaxID=1380685 RepID=A0A7D4CNS8_9BACL|nr:hypothetical protein [Kroppenstedtia pulmonis]QKG85018.1 hypothetical protein GXN76_11420 [Kroppenstedtia pulmonis]
MQEWTLTLIETAIYFNKLSVEAISESKYLDPDDVIKNINFHDSYHTITHEDLNRWFPDKGYHEPLYMRLNHDFVHIKSFNQSLRNYFKFHWESSIHVSYYHNGLLLYSHLLSDFVLYLLYHQEVGTTGAESLDE